MQKKKKSLRNWMENANLLCFLNPLILFGRLKWWIGFSLEVCKGVNFTVGELKSHQEQGRLGLFYCRSVAVTELIPSWNGLGKCLISKAFFGNGCIIQPYAQNIWCWHTENVLVKGATGVMKDWQLCKLNNSQNKSENARVSISCNQNHQVNILDR